MAKRGFRSQGVRLVTSVEIGVEEGKTKGRETQAQA